MSDAAGDLNYYREPTAPRLFTSTAHRKARHDNHALWRLVSGEPRWTEIRRGGRDFLTFGIDTIIAGSPRWERDMLYVYGQLLRGSATKGQSDESKPGLRRQ
jgi:hypothetical protein